VFGRPISTLKSTASLQRCIRRARLQRSCWIACLKASVYHAHQTSMRCKISYHTKTPILFSKFHTQSSLVVFPKTFSHVHAQASGLLSPQRDGGSSSSWVPSHTSPSSAPNPATRTTIFATPTSRDSSSTRGSRHLSAGTARS